MPVDERSVAVRRDLAIVLDDMDFFPDLSVIEHLDLFARAHGVPDAEALVDDVLEEVRLIAQAAQLPGTLSSGQKRGSRWPARSCARAGCWCSTSPRRGWTRPDWSG